MPIDISQLNEYIDSYNERFLVEDFSRLLEAYLQIPGHTINDKNTDSKTLLMTAAYYGRITVVSLLLEKGADLNIQDDCGYTALKFAMSGLNKAPPNVTIMQILLDAKANPELQDCNGRSILSYLADNEIPSEIQMAELLVRHGAQVNPKCCAEQTPLSLAIKNNKLSLAQFLINECANRNEKIFNGFEANRIKHRTKFIPLVVVNAMYDEYMRNIGCELIRQAALPQAVAKIVNSYVFYDPPAIIPTSIEPTTGAIKSSAKKKKKK